MLLRVAATILFLIAAVAESADFGREVYPILEKSCFGCHGPKTQMGGLRLDSKRAAFTGGQSGKVILPGNAAASALYQRVAGATEQPRMPIGAKPLEVAQIALIKSWIDGGAVWPEGIGVQAGEVNKHWAFEPPTRPPLPALSNRKWPANPIDYFVLVRLEKEVLQPSPEADKVTLLRRLSLDLTGLPPSIEDIDGFLADNGPRAYEKQVERLLASPHYGERWGRHWLDAARYAD